MLVNTNWLSKNYNDNNLIILDASYYVDGGTIKAKKLYEANHIPNAIFFDIDKIADLESNLPHTMPSKSFFSNKVGELGISKDNNIIIYDSANGVSAASRAWWMFKAFGHNNVSILDGGIVKWKSENLPVNDLPVIYRKKKYKSSQDANKFIATKEDILNNIGNSKFKVLDARSPGRFYGKEVEPRPNLRSGHIPKSINVHYSELIDKKIGIFKSETEIKNIFKEKNLNISDEIIASCGSGVTACALAFCLYLIGKNNTYIYDGSWVEWGSDEKLPIEK